MIMITVNYNLMVLKSVVLMAIVIMHCKHNYQPKSIPIESQDAITFISLV